MKRYGNLYPDIIAFANLILAADRAQKGKRFRDNVLEFNYNREKELIRLQRELTDKTYQHGKYRTFYIREPKIRMISAAPYRDRVVHHALCNIITPIFEKTFIHDSYANREGFGTHRALTRFTEFARSSRYILQCDVQKYFPSIDHDILKTTIRRKIKCRDTLWLIDHIIDNSNEQFYVDEYCQDGNPSILERRKGLPLGNLTSQFFANIYLNELDHFVKEQLKCRKYLRYVDDFCLFDDDKKYLIDARLAIEDYLEKIRLKIHPVKTQIFETKIGATFVGFRVFPDFIRVKTQNIRRARKRVRRMQREFREGKIEAEDINASMQSWMAHLKHGNTWKLRQKLFSSLAFVRN